jgi:hypothetical protein
MLKPTEQEKQGVVCLMEAVKPLPEKHRSLMFNNKRAVELVGSDNKFILISLRNRSLGERVGA